MIHKYLLLILLIPFSAVATVNVELFFDSQEVKQGSIENAKALLTSDSIQKVNFQKIKGQTLGETIYFYSLSPFVRKEGEKNYISDVKIIFVKVPTKNRLEHKVDGQDIVISLPQIKVTPVDIPEKLIFEQFDIPESFKYFKWIIVFFILVILCVLTLKYRQRTKNKHRELLKKKAIKESVLAATSYKDVVNVWQRKSEVISIFPSWESEFKELEKTLFKFQFKPSQSEIEKSEVMKAYDVFLNNVKGGFDGI